MSVDAKLARARLENAAHAKDKIKQWAWLMAIGAIALLALVGFATIDYWLMLPPLLRYAASAILATVVSLGAWGLRRLFRKPTSLKEAALDAEAQRRDLDCIVSTAAEYTSGQAQTANAYELELAAALQAEAAERLELVQMPYRRRLWGPLSVLGTALVAVMIFAVATPAARTALKRIILPWMRAQYTELEVKPGTLEVRSGQSVEISGFFFGRLPRDPMLQWRAIDDPAWQTASLKRSRDGAFVHPIQNVTAPMKYRVSGGDAVSPEFRVTPYIPPEVKYLSIGLAYPEYTKLRPLTQSSPEITILRGSTATVHLRPNVSLSRARIRFSDRNTPPVELRKNENDLWTGNLKVEKDVAYFIELFDQKGRKGDDDQSHRIMATADNPPQVEILEPSQDMRADVTNSVPVKVSVADDYGVGGINLVFHKLNSAEQTIACQTESAKNGEWIAIAEINLAMLGLRRYDVVAYHVEARDNNTLDGPGIGRSPLYFIEITDKESAPTPPLPPVPGEQINLLVFQKQIIADTAALNSKSPETDYLELVSRQTNAAELAHIYLKTMAGAPPEAIAQMSSAIASMEQAVGPLSRRDRLAAVPPEEAALAHLYRVLASLPDLKTLVVTPMPQLPKEQKPQMAVSLREIRKPAPQPPPVDPGIENALEEAKELSRAQAELNEIGQKVLGTENRDQNTAEAPGPHQARAQQTKADGKGEGQDQGDANGQGNGEGKGENTPETPDLAKQFAKSANTNNVDNNQQPSSQTAEVYAQKSTEDASKPTRSGNNSAASSGTNQTPQLALAKANGEGKKLGKGQGKGKGKAKAKAAGQKGKGKGQGAKPGDGSGQPSTQQSGEPPEMAADGQPENDAETREELAQKQEELSAEAKALGEMLERLAGQGTRVGHNLARSANKAAEHMEGAAQALKQGNASGAGRRGTMSSAELDQVVTELERILGKRPDLTDVASEEAPKEYEAFISEYFKKLSYEK